MASYYNELDPFAAAWLRELIKAGHIAPGEVDERSIEDVQPGDIKGFVQCHWFAGIGVWSYALRLAGWPDDRPVWTGSCPCPSFSAAGKGEGFDDPRHLWPDWFGLIRKCRPAILFGEQADGAIGFGWLDLVQSDLEAAGYAVGAAVFGAHSVGAPHIRQRLYFVADTARECLDGISGIGRQPRGASEQERRQSGGGGATFGSPLALHAERRAHDQHGPDGRDGADGGRAEACGEPGTYGEVCERPDTDGGDPGTKGLQRSGQQRLLGEAGDGSDAHGRGLQDRRPQGSSESRNTRNADLRSAPEELCDSSQPVSTRLEGHAGDERIGHGPGWLDPESARSIAASGATRGFWAGCDWWYGRDGKYRPTQPGLFPLAYGAPARVGRLRGFGNCIVAPQAEAFIRAYCEAKRG